MDLFERAFGSHSNPETFKKAVCHLAWMMQSDDALIVEEAKELLEKYKPQLDAHIERGRIVMEEGVVKLIPDKQPLLRIIGDVHGEMQPYMKLAKEAENSICVGDIGFEPQYRQMSRLDPAKHKMIPGNHDDPHHLPPHSLGDFGVYTVPGFGDIFFVRGAFSIDVDYRTPGHDWFPEEELNRNQMEAALKLYQEVKPDFMITHDAPLSVISCMGLPNLPSHFKLGAQRTPRLLDMMWNSHEPKTWVFGHFHRNWKETIRGTNFQCVHILSFVDYDTKPEDQACSPKASV
jgi:predicted phosphodiesterase